ncbi:LON peptidase substrate-binding domain-containing protein [Segnochrobactrum spirostomi]|uniref:Lon N-terminal domain-containing protein n=1 Tax=Segnochrobactrum spirostomi TaxID=2608987 RepID=A0A6A7Y179_9HYPH|nr:LON peptidase substrate-binding domain-containing protein [Segnochrobactrum spirostomi]MQT12810.1 hypothetical protein [Segnochrobactrum spirostomi]
MQVGNATYDRPEDLPETIPLFPLSAALLLPRGQMPLNVFEPRYMAMIDAVLAGDRVIGIVQPRFDLGEVDLAAAPPLCAVGCAGRLTALQESGDGRYLLSLTGICRFRLLDEVTAGTPFRVARVSAAEFAEDFEPDRGQDEVDRQALLDTFRAYLEANHLETDWPSVERASNETLVNALSMMSPYGPAEKQALLEAPDLRSRAETLVAITEVTLVRAEQDGDIRIN